MGESRSNGRREVDLEMQPEVQNTSTDSTVRFTSRPTRYSAGGNFDIKFVEAHHNRTTRLLLARDPYHSLLSLPLLWILLFFMCCHVASWLLYVPVYMAISRPCALGARTPLRALYYSVITQSTIGYGTPDTQFDHCISALFAIMTQTVLGLVLNGVLVGTVYTKIARSKQRSVRIVFSDKACIRQIRNRYYFMFQTFDRSSSVSHNQLIEAHVRCYAIKHETTGDNGEPIFFQQCAMRLSNPNDELGAPLMMALPTLVIHRIDQWSPLCPPPAYKPSPDEQSGVDGSSYARTAMNTFHCAYPSLVLREDDCETGGRVFCACEVCGEAFETPEQLELHRTASAASERFQGGDTGTISEETDAASPKHDSTQRSCVNISATNSSVSATVQRTDPRRKHMRHLPFAALRGKTIGGKLLRSSEAAKAMRGGASRAIEPGDDSERTLLITDQDTEGDAAVPSLRVVQPLAPSETVRSSANDGEGIELVGINKTQLTTLGSSYDPSAEPWRDLERIKEHLSRTGLEVLVYVEAIETYTSSTMQARHSYHFETGDIEFDSGFVPCVQRGTDGKPLIDIDAFHRLRPAPRNAHAMLSTPSIV